MDLGLSGRSYFVTGGSSGIGYACVQELLDEGAVVGTCSRDLARLESAWDHLPARARERLHLTSADVTQPASMAEVIDAFVRAAGALDGVVANAGTGSVGGVLDTPQQEWLDQCRTKLFGTLNLVQPAVDHLQRSSAGRVVVINATTSAVPDPDMAAVSAARAALAQLVTLLAGRLAENRICVNAVDVGVVDTERQRSRYRGSGSTMGYDEWTSAEACRRGVPFGRMATPSEVAGVVAFLLSARASYVTGANVPVSGGKDTCAR